MIDFNALMNHDVTDNTIDPIDIFEELPKSGKIDNLYHVQAEILQKWYSDLRDKTDVVIELNTGGGKTLVGLLMALSTMRETGAGVLYLVENNQLRDQVVSQAVDLGITAKAYRGHESIDADFDNGNSILVGAYQALFNGKSVFGVRGAREAQMLGGIVIDDAHASLNAVRNAFSLSIPVDEAETLYKEVLGEFQGAFTAIDRPTTYRDFQEGTGDSIVEIPFPYWLKAIRRVSSYIREECRKRESHDDSFSKDLVFKWPLIKDDLKYCQVVVSRTQITIVAFYPILEMIPSFQRAQRRIYMSATITDYGDMVRAYDLRHLTEQDIIAPKTVAGVGRRMILNLPAGIARSAEFADLIKSEVAAGHGVVRLSPRQNMGSEWSGICFEEPIGHGQVCTAVDDLRSGEASNPVSFTNRYNGIDLPGDACRVLVLHGLPSGVDDIDILMSQYLVGSDLTAQRLAQRVEQGLGRGVRGAGDHCVVLLEGNDLIEWMKKDKNRRHMSSALVAQLEIGDEICTGLDTPSAYCEAMRQDFDSNEDWKKFHAGRLAKHVSKEDASRFDLSFSAACAERKAFAQWREHGNGDACHKLEERVNDICDDEFYQGWLLSLASRIAYEGGDAPYASMLSQKAHSINKFIPCAQNESYEEAANWAHTRAKRICAAIDDTEVTRKFNTAVAAHLSFSSNNKLFGEALMQLGRYLGFVSERADDHGTGPDVYWLSEEEGVGVVLEAKNERDPNNPLPKKDAGQLRTAHDWLQQKHPNLEVLSVSVHPNAKADYNASAENLMALTPDSLSQLVEATRLLISDATDCLPKERKQHIAYEVINRHLGIKDLSNKYFVSFESN